MTTTTFTYKGQTSPQEVLAEIKRRAAEHAWKIDTSIGQPSVVVYLEKGGDTIRFDLYRSGLGHSARCQDAKGCMWSIGFVDGLALMAKKDIHLALDTWYNQNTKALEDIDL